MAEQLPLQVAARPALAAVVHQVPGQATLPLTVALAALATTTASAELALDMLAAAVVVIAQAGRVDRHLTVAVLAASVFPHGHQHREPPIQAAVVVAAQLKQTSLTVPALLVGQVLSLFAMPIHMMTLHLILVQHLQTLAAIKF